MNQNELDEILQDDIKIINNTLHEAKENELSLSVDEITYRISKAPEHKLRCNINTSHITEEEARPCYKMIVKGGILNTSNLYTAQQQSFSQS